MAVKISDIETLSRQRLVEVTPRFWTSDELNQMTIAGIRDLWRDIADLKQEHFLTFNFTDVMFPPQSDQLIGVPADVHKVYLVEAHDITTTSSNVGLQFKPLDYNHNNFQLARSRDAIDPSNDTIYYALTAPGGPVGPPVIKAAPKVTSNVKINFSYVPSLGDMTKDTPVPIPGESTNALVAWTVAFARAKERDDRAPDANWLAIYATEKQHLLQSLGLRDYQEPFYGDAIWQEYWGILLAAGITLSSIFT